MVLAAPSIMDRGALGLLFVPLARLAVIQLGLVLRHIQDEGWVRAGWAHGRTGGDAEMA